MSEDQRYRTSENELMRRLLNAGIEVTGGSATSVVSAALGFLVAGPVGVAIGGAAGAGLMMALRKVGSEVDQRLLGPRERRRVGEVLTLGAVAIQKRIKRGDILRTDGFFDSKQSGRSDAEEVAESVLLKSQREPEEQKLPYMAHLLANISFDIEISPEMAHQITKAAEQLTYRQLCLLKLAVNKDAYGLRRADYRGQEGFSKELYQVLDECFDLYRRAYVNFGGKVAFGPTDVKPGEMTVQGIGADMFNLMDLSLVPNEDIEPMAMRLQ